MYIEKLYVEIFLVILLLVLLNGNIPILSDLSNQIYGKILLIFLIYVISLRYGTTCGVLGALVYLLLNNKYKEGMAIGSVKKCKTNRDCGACKSTCVAGQCNLESIKGSEYKESFIGYVSSDREKKENDLNKNSQLNTLSASHP